MEKAERALEKETKELTQEREKMGREWKRIEEERAKMERANKDYVTGGIYENRSRNTWANSTYRNRTPGKRSIRKSPTNRKKEAAKRRRLSIPAKRN